MEFLCIVGVIVFLYLLGSAAQKPQRKHKPKYRRTYLIYGLKDGRKIFYVGQTSRSIQQRLNEHLIDTTPSPKTRYLSNMAKHHKPVSYTILAKTSSKPKADSLEIQYIKRYGITNILHRN